VALLPIPAKAAADRASIKKIATDSAESFFMAGVLL
jgi:hypothetical protein